MNVIITLAALWILRAPILALLGATIWLIMLPFVLLGVLYDHVIDNLTFSCIVLASIGGTCVYLTS